MLWYWAMAPDIRSCKKLSGPQGTGEFLLTVRGTRLLLLAAAEELAEALGQFLIDLLFDLVLG